MRHVLAVGLLAFLGGCATGPAGPDHPSTLSDLLLAMDASEKMGGDARCRNRTVSTTEVLVPVELTTQGVSGRWTERWTVDRCGVSVPYVVKFDRARDGDLDVSMQREVADAEAATVPGDTLADPRPPARYACISRPERPLGGRPAGALPDPEDRRDRGADAPGRR